MYEPPHAKTYTNYVFAFFTTHTHTAGSYIKQNTVDCKCGLFHKQEKRVITRLIPLHRCQTLQVKKRNLHEFGAQ